MTRWEKALLTLALTPLVLLLPALAYGGAIKQWSSGEQVQAADLNNNFNHLHNELVGGEGARLRDADVRSDAAIGHYKLATPALIPKAVALVGAVGSAPCTGASAVDTVSCVLNFSNKVTSVKSSGTAGKYRVTLSYTPTNTNFAVLTTSATSGVLCNAHSYNTTAPNFILECFSVAGGAATDALVSFVLLSN